MMMNQHPNRTITLSLFAMQSANTSITLLFWLFNISTFVLGTLVSVFFIYYWQLQTLLQEILLSFAVSLGAMVVAAAVASSVVRYIQTSPRVKTAKDAEDVIGLTLFIVPLITGAVAYFYLRMHPTDDFIFAASAIGSLCTRVILTLLGSGFVAMFRRKPRV